MLKGPGCANSWLTRPLELIAIAMSGFTIISVFPSSWIYLDCDCADFLRDLGHRELVFESRSFGIPTFI